MPRVNAVAATDPNASIWSRPLFPKWRKIEGDKFLDLRYLSEQQAAPISLTGKQPIPGTGGRRFEPIIVDDGIAPTATGINAALRREVELDPDNKALRNTLDWVSRPTRQNDFPGEFTIPNSKVPRQSFTRIAPLVKGLLGTKHFTPRVDSREIIYPSMLNDSASMLNKSYRNALGAGAPVSQLSEGLIGLTIAEP
jgi:hypothetical protein